MFHGVWQLAKLTLEADGRRLGAHGLRFGMVATLYLAVCFFQSSAWKSASGRELFQMQLQITAFFLSMTAVFGFSQAITEEKEENTLGLMRLADISPLAVILGKSASLFAEAGLLVGIQIPFTLVAITLGGISWPQVVAAYVALAAYLWMLVFVGVFASVTQPTGARAARLTAVVVAAYLLIPHLIVRFSFVWGTSLGEFLAEKSSLSLRLIEVTASGFVDSPWCPAVILGMITGALCLALSWLLFDRFALADSLPKTPILSLTRRQRTSRRSWPRPIIWYEYAFSGGGIPWTMVRIAIPCGIWILAYLYFKDLAGVPLIGFTCVWSALVSGLFSLLDGSWSVSRLFRDEIRYKTWASLVQTPYTMKQIVFDKYRGWALALAPTIAAPFLLIGATLIFHENVNDWNQRIELLIGTFTIGVSVFGYLVLLALLSLDFGWKATPMALTICFTAGALYVRCIDFSWSYDSRWILFLFTDLLIAALTCWFHMLIVKRLTQLAAIT